MRPSLIAMLLLASCAHVPNPVQDARPLQRGMVVDALTQQPIDDARVTVWYAADPEPLAAFVAHVSTEKGAFRFRLAGAHRYVIGVEKEGYAWARVEQPLPADGAAPVQISLSPQAREGERAPGAVTLHIHDVRLHLLGDRVVPLPPTRSVAYAWSAANVHDHAHAHIEGTPVEPSSSMLNDLAPGLYEIGLLGDAAFLGSSLFVEVKPGQKTDLVLSENSRCLELAPRAGAGKASLSGKVLGPGGEPAQGVSLALWRRTSEAADLRAEKVNVTWSAEDGRFVVRDLAPGVYRVVAVGQAPDYFAGADVDVVAGAEPAIQLGLEHGSAREQGDVDIALRAIALVSVRKSESAANALLVSKRLSDGQWRQATPEEPQVFTCARTTDETAAR